MISGEGEHKPTTSMPKRFANTRFANGSQTAILSWVALRDHGAFAPGVGVRRGQDRVFGAREL